MQERSEQPVESSGRREYPLHQCALYKLSSKGKLAALLELEGTADLFRLSPWEDNYKVFLKPEEICPFVGKKTKARWVQEPKDELKNVQKRIQKLLARVRAPVYCHGGLAGYSYRSNAKAHVGGNRCATFDIKSFFPSTPSSRVFNFFKDTLRCEPDVAKVLTDLCCYDGVLPTGAPTSPILSLYANSQLFESLASLARVHKLVFTVYIDDITFSGDVIPRGIASMVQSIVRKGGHKLSLHKTKQFGKGDPRHVTGVVIHDGRVKVPHSRFLKARAIQAAINRAETVGEKLKLTNKLVGLVGEAAYLDERFKPKAQAVYAAAEALKDELSTQPAR